MGGRSKRIVIDFLNIYMSSDTGIGLGDYTFQLYSGMIS